MIMAVGKTQMSDAEREGHYRTLKLTSGAYYDEVKRAYRAIARRTHSDVTGSMIPRNLMQRQRHLRHWRPHLGQMHIKRKRRSVKCTGQKTSGLGRLILREIR